MKILNLAYPDKSDIKYKVIKFPDGQQQIDIDDQGYSEDITIKSRLNNFMDLELIICARKALRNNGYIRGVHLYTPYILGSRSDRHFGSCSTNYLRDVICPIINSLNFDSVTCIDPHSDVLEACLDNFNKTSNGDLVGFALQEIYEKNGRSIENARKDMDYILISPDLGAYKKVSAIAKRIGYLAQIATCTKLRDLNGQLSDLNISFHSQIDTKKDLIIIDDICDGGATFLNIAKDLRKPSNTCTNNKIYLIVTHGIFSKGFEELSQYFDHIICTNSYSDIDCDFDTIKNPNKDFVSQLNVF